MRVILLATGLVLAACSAALVHPGPADAEVAARRWPGTTVTALEGGREIYVARCSRCHALHLPEEYPAASWPALVEAMSSKAKLSPEEQAEVTRFLVTTSARVRSEPLPPTEGAAAAPVGPSAPHAAAPGGAGGARRGS
jgi:hypothetical protein